MFANYHVCVSAAGSGEINKIQSKRIICYEEQMVELMSPSISPDPLSCYANILAC